MSTDANEIARKNGTAALRQVIDKNADARPPQFSEEAIALRFAELHSGERRFVALWNRWLSWEGTCWRVDETQRTTELSRRLCRKISAECNKQKNKKTIARVIASRKTVEAVERLARADSRIAAHPDQFDADQWALNTPSGIIDLRSGQVRPNKASDHCTKITAVAPDSSCSIPTWLSFLDRVADRDAELISYLQRALGYMLTGSTRDHALFFGHGPGATGKSTLLKAVTGCVGDYHRTAAIETFTASKNERHPTDLAALRGARIVTAVETEEGRRWAESKIKALTGGDRIAARFMRADFFEFDPTFKLFIVGNHLPGLRSVDEAIRRRFHLVPFTTIIPLNERDVTLGEKLKLEWPGILWWMILGCLEWQQHGLAPPAVIRAATDSYLESEDSLGAWIEGGVRDPNAWEYTEDLFNSWKKYAGRAGEYVGSLTKFSQRLQDRAESIGLRKDRDGESGRRGFYGLRLLPAAPAPGADDGIEPPPDGIEP